LYMNRMMLKELPGSFKTIGIRLGEEYATAFASKVFDSALS